MTKRTYQPRIHRRVRVHGFRARMETADGREVLKRRRAKGRRKVDSDHEQPRKTNSVVRSNPIPAL